MTQRLLMSFLAGVLCTAAWQSVRADVYAWADASGTVTFSDVPPPAGARVLNVVSEPPRNAHADAAAALDREIAREVEVRVLSERVRQLERQIETASLPAPASVRYQPMPAMNGGCQYWADCGPWWTQPVYPAGVAVVVVPGRGFRHFHRFHGVRGFAHRPGTFILR